jgi:hypothetical protein
MSTTFQNYINKVQLDRGYINQENLMETVSKYVEIAERNNLFYESDKADEAIGLLAALTTGVTIISLPVILAASIAIGHMNKKSSELPVNNKIKMSQQIKNITKDNFDKITDLIKKNNFKIESNDVKKINDLRSTKTEKEFKDYLDKLDAKDSIYKGK